MLLLASGEVRCMTTLRTAVETSLLHAEHFILRLATEILCNVVSFSLLDSLNLIAFATKTYTKRQSLPTWLPFEASFSTHSTCY